MIQGMRILQISDLHGNLGFIDENAGEIRRADVVVLSGDITNFAGREKAEQIIESIRRHNKNIVGIPGNCDLPEVDTYLQEIGVSIHTSTREMAGATFCGVGGSLPCPRKTPTEYTEAEMASMLTTLPQKADATTVFVSHHPPYDTKADTVKSGAHVGSRSIRSFIEQAQPLLGLSGHIHESSGKDAVGATVVINPGPARDGRYAVIEIDDQREVLVTLSSL